MEGDILHRVRTFYRNECRNYGEEKITKERILVRGKVTRLNLACIC